MHKFQVQKLQEEIKSLEHYVQKNIWKHAIVAGVVFSLLLAVVTLIIFWVIQAISGTATAEEWINKPSWISLGIGAILWAVVQYLFNRRTAKQLTRRKRELEQLLKEEIIQNRQSV